MKTKVKFNLGMLIIVFTLVALSVLALWGFWLQSGVRAYVGAEGLWGKNQKEASFHLLGYIHNEDPQEYEAFNAHLLVPLGDREARLEMQSEDPDEAVITAGFIAGGNHADDIPAMIMLFRYAWTLSSIERAIEQWEIADNGIAALVRLGEQIHADVEAGGLDGAARVRHAAELRRLQTQLTTAEDSFSLHMSESSRVVQQTLVVVVVGFAILGALLCFLILRMIWRVVADLSHSEGRFRRLTENARDLIYRMELPSGRYEYMSPAAEAIFGYTPEEFYTRANLIGELIHPDSQDYFKEQWTKLLAGDMPDVYEYKVRHASGETRWLNQRNVLVRDASGRPIAIEGIVSDITGRKALEAKRASLELRLHQSEKMEAIGTLAGGIAHDFNNILSAILGHTELAELDLPPGSPVKENLDEILQASLRARDLVRRILAFSRQRVLERKPVEMTKVVEEAVGLMRASLPATIEISTQLQSTDGIVLADSSELHRVIVNLCANAAYGMERDGGRLTVTLGAADTIGERVPPSSMSAPGSGPFLKLSVTDTGPGIEASILDRIFDPYFTTKPTGKGSGMGLAVVNGIISAHGGTITLQSQPGEGTTFHVYLPHAEPEPGTPERPAEVVEAGHERILFVDDEPSVVRFAVMLIKKLGYEVTALESSPEALDIFRSNPEGFDLVITDLTMPQMTGIELATAIQTIRPGVPVILCTGFSADASADTVTEAGIRACLTKPFRRAELADTIRRALDKDQAAPPT